MNETYWLQVRFGIVNYTLVFATVRLTVRAPILRFYEEKHTMQPSRFALWQGYHKTRGGLDWLSGADQLGKTFVDVYEGRRIEENTLQYCCSSIEGSIVEAYEVIGPSGSGSNTTYGTRAVATLDRVDKIAVHRPRSR